MSLEAIRVEIIGVHGDDYYLVVAVVEEDKVSCVVCGDTHQGKRMMIVHIFDEATRREIDQSHRDYSAVKFWARRQYEVRCGYNCADPVLRKRFARAN
jgi:hypothetical protein